MTPDALLWSPQRHGSWPGWWRRQARQRRGCCGSGPYPLAAEDPGRLDQRQVGERLREVADLPAAGDVVLLGVQAQVVAQSLPGTLPGPAAADCDLRGHEAFTTDKRPYRRRPSRWLADGWGRLRTGMSSRCCWKGSRSAVSLSACSQAYGTG